MGYQDQFLEVVKSNVEIGLLIITIGDDTQTADGRKSILEEIGKFLPKKSVIWIPWRATTRGVYESTNLTIGTQLLLKESYIPALI